jgi:hypothetical protein
MENKSDEPHPRIVGGFKVMENISESKAEERLMEAYETAKNEKNIYALVRNDGLGNYQLSLFVPLIYDVFGTGFGSQHYKITPLDDGTVAPEPGSFTVFGEKTTLQDIMTPHIIQYYPRQCPIYWAVSDEEQTKMLLPLNFPLQQVDSSGKSTPLGVLVVDKQNPDGKVYEWNENIQYNGFKIFNLERNQAHAIIASTRRRYQSLPAVLIRKGTRTTIGADGTFENLVVTCESNRKLKDVLFSCTQDVNLVKSKIKRKGKGTRITDFQFENLISDIINEQKSYISYKIEGGEITEEVRVNSTKLDDDQDAS